MCAMTQYTHGACAHATTGAELIHGVPARKAVLELEDVRIAIITLQER
jgi:hypothetical protein